MTDEKWISKKELLEITGISYGQLYRWKRKNLIPENWFIKQSSYTGQETFFPRSKILDRIAMIQGLKDQYELDDLANMLSPELSSRRFSYDLLSGLEALDPMVLSVFQKITQKQTLLFKELLFVFILSELKREYTLDEKKISELVQSIRDWLPSLRDTAYRLVVFEKNSDDFIMLIQSDAQLLLDYRVNQKKVYHLEEVSKDLHLILEKIEEDE